MDEPQPSQPENIASPVERRTVWSSSKKLVIAGSVLAVLLVAGIGLALKAVLSNPDSAPATRQNVADNSDSDTNSSQTPVAGGNGSALSGGTSKLKGGVVSLRNLKGLTLRINQLDTCTEGSITAYVAVATDQGVVTTNFNKNDVKVYLDNKEVKDFSFEPVSKTKQPINNILVIDHSGSMKGAPMDSAKAAAAAYVQATNPDDKTAIIQFDTQVDVLYGLGSDKAAAVAAINGIQHRGDTALYDALVGAVDQLPACGRKAVTVLSDGGDTASKSATAQSAGQKAVDGKLPIFAMGLKGESFNPTILRQMSDASGGQYLEANTPADITGLYKNIDGQLRGQFATGLKIKLKRDGQSHTIRIVSNVQGSPTESTRTFGY